MRVTPFDEFKEKCPAKNECPPDSCNLIRSQLCQNLYKKMIEQEIIEYDQKHKDE